MAEKFIEWDATSNRFKQNEGLVVSTGASDAGKIPALAASGKLDATVIPSILQNSHDAAVITMIVGG